MYFGFTWEWGMGLVEGIHRMPETYEYWHKWSPWCVPDKTDFTKIWTTNDFQRGDVYRLYARSIVPYLKVSRGEEQMPVGHGYVMLRSPPASYVRS